jgi:hypothetical protein
MNFLRAPSRIFAYFAYFAVQKDGASTSLESRAAGKRLANCRATKKTPRRGEAGRGVKSREPQVRIELTTARLRIECSTTELLWRMTSDGGTNGAARSCMPWRGLEPRRLSAPPPQDGVSTNFTTRATGGSCGPAAARPDRRCGAASCTTGATGLEPATSRVTVECSNQTELRPPTTDPRG